MTDTKTPEQISALERRIKKTSAAKRAPLLAQLQALRKAMEQHPSQSPAPMPPLDDADKKILAIVRQYSSRH